MAFPARWLWIPALSVLLLLGVRAQAPAPAPSASSQPLLKPAELEALVAPIALYPDALLAEILMAATYPLEVVEAGRWLGQNGQLQGDQLKAAVDKQSWDKSVKSLVATPSVLQMMSARLDWMQKLGDAVLAQQSDVMDAVQRMRAKAYDNKKLTSTKEQNVTVSRQDDKQVIAIEPAAADVVAVPYYDPAVVYGDWPYPEYPPYSFAAPDYIPGAIIATGIAFGAGYLLGRWRSGGDYWGGGFRWGRGDINVNRPINIDRNRITQWQHNPQHRRGVQYRNANVQQKFGNVRNRPGAGNRAPANRAASRRPAASKRANVANRGSINRRGGSRTASHGRRAASGRHHPAHTARSRTARARAHGAHARRGHAGVRHAGRPHAGHHRRGGGQRFVHRGGGFRGGGRGRRSDLRLKHDIVLLGHLDNGIGYYRFAYNGSDKAYVGVLAQEVLTVAPDAVTRGRDGYLSVSYEKLGLKFQTYRQWLASGAGHRLQQSGRSDER